MRYVARFGLEKEEEVAIFLRLFVVWEETFLRIDSVIKAVRNLVLLTDRQ
jgi:hypothetical protein